jgi:hypothetical protein
LERSRLFFGRLGVSLLADLAAVVGIFVEHLGTAKTAILWYRPKDSPTYRVIYADLKVADAAPENLPK